MKWDIDNIDIVLPKVFGEEVISDTMFYISDPKSADHLLFCAYTR